METTFFAYKCEEQVWLSMNNLTPDNLIINTGTREPAEQVEPQLLLKVVIAQGGPFEVLHVLDASEYSLAQHSHV